VVASELAARQGKQGGEKRRGRALLAGAGAAALIFCFSPLPVHAQTWKGTTSSDWTVGSNWSTGAVPTSAGTVMINTNSPNPTVLGVSGPVTATIGTLYLSGAPIVTTPVLNTYTSALTIQNGSSLSSGVSNIGYWDANGSAVGSATVTVTGLGSSWSASSVAVGTGSTSGITGRSAPGTLNIANGAAVNVAGTINFGQSSGSGTLNVTGGGTLATGNATMWDLGANTVNTANISGTGSKWSVSGSLIVGFRSSGTAGTSTLNVANGGALVATGDITLGGTNLSTAGAGTVTVTGSGSQLSTSGTLNIGLWGKGNTLTVSNGAVATANTVMMTAASVNAAFSTATFNLSSGGTLATQALTAGAGTAQVNFDGAILRATASNTAFVSGFTGTELNVAAGGLTVDTGSFTDTAASPFTGAGALTKVGVGALVLTGDSSYAGGTTISAGTLQLGNGGTSGSITGNVANNGTLVFDRTDVYTFGGTISGSGAVNQIGSGTTILTGNSTYAGGTTISGGTLQLGNGSTSGSFTGNVTNNGTLAFDRSDIYTYGGVISGSGAVNQIGTGTTILTGNNTYAGGTAINGGTLQVASDTNLGNASGALSFNGGTLQNMASFASARTVTLNAGGGTFQITSNLTWTGAIGGTGALTKTDAGTLLLSADNTYTGGTAITTGTLQLGNGGTNGSITGDVADNGALAFNRSDVYSFGSVISGSGAVNQLGSGTTVLTNDNTYTGGTTITAGTLQLGNGGTSGSITGDVTDNGTLAFNRSDVYNFGGAISGSGAVNQLGSGTTVLTSGNTYAGGTTITAGTLQLGNGGTSGSITGNVTDNGTLAFSRSDVYSFAGVISGGGALNQLGNGATVLTNGNTYAGGTTITAGTLQLGNGGTSGSIIGNVTDNGTLAFNRSDVYSFGGVISGSGAVNQLGSGTAVLTNDNTYTGGTTITAGMLQLGNGGTSGSITGNVVDNSALAFNRSDSVMLGGVISGSGSVAQAGAGITTLTGTNTYRGATTVQAGTLLVDGNQSGATGLTTVQSGATLGGTGTLGGNVTIANGGVLSPGDAGAGTLTVNGNLSLNSGSALDYQFGQANTPGGALNDLTVVHGNLTLAGALHVSTTAGGSFGPGVYRVFNYAGTLTNNGLSIGSAPAGTYYMQTSIANQVNLVNSTGLTLNFWDGTAGPKNNGVINGGNGTWQNTSGNDNWADSTGQVNAPYTNGAFAVFQAAPGTVTVDNTLGNVTTSGMQFAVNGYTVTGNALTLTGASNIIRVGDGTSAGADMTATINAALAGTGGVQKTDLGTLVLNGTNTYAGGTTVQAGTLQVSSDANLGAASGALTLGNGSLHTTASFQTNRAVSLAGNSTFQIDDGTTLTLAHAVSGAGSLAKTGAGTLALDAASTYSGATTVTAGTLQAAVANALSASSAITVATNGTLDLAGFTQNVASLTNAGIVHFGSTPGTTLRVQGNYAGQGGTLNFNTVLGGDNAATDQLIVNGSTSGTSVVHVTNVGGTGAATTQGIKLIDVQGASNGTFSLAGNYVFQGQQAVVGGAYAYRLHQGGTTTPNDGNWYLSSSLLDLPTTSSTTPPSQTTITPRPLYQPGVPLYEAYAGVLRQINTLDSLYERVADRSWANGASATGATAADGVWLRVQGAGQTYKPQVSTSGGDYNVSSWKTEAGLDARLGDTAGGALVAGASLQFGRYQTNVDSLYGAGRIKTSSYGIGTTLTWYGDGGLYVDGQWRWTRFDSDLYSTTAAQVLKNGNKGSGYAIGVEVGQRFRLADAWSLIPQAQVSYGRAVFNAFSDVYGADVSVQQGQDVVGRAGLAIDYRSTAYGPIDSHLYAIANLYRDFEGATRVDVSGTDLVSRNERLWGGLGVGGSLDWGHGLYSIYGEVQGRTGLSHFGDSHDVTGTLGFRMRW
jgi:fibronectin-binding autotransporter adhesin